MSTAIAGVPYQAHYTPTANGQPYDPELAGGAVLRLEVLSQDDPPLVLADVGPAVKAGSADYVFPAVTLAAGTYGTRITWTPAAGAAAVVDTDQQLVVAALGGSIGESLPDWTPTPQDVADVIPRRARDADGLGRGTFTADTVPSAQQVSRIAAQFAIEIASAVRVLPAALHQQARQVAALGAASQIELSFYPEAREGTAVPLGDRYRQALAGLVRAASNLSSAAGGAGLPRGSFPPPGGVHAEFAERPYRWWG
jgi:hypothetical protein